MDWIIEEVYDRTGVEHMSRDEALTRALGSDSGHPNVLRLYTWRPAAISLGYQQKDSEIDYERISQDGMDVVRRPTGGRAVLHANELTYAVIMGEPDGLGIYATHNMISEALLRSFEGLGPSGLSLSTNNGSQRERYGAGT